MLVAMVARVVGALALMVAAGGQAFAEEPAAKATVTPFQAMVPVLATPPAPAQVPPAPESEIIEGDPRRKNRWQQTDQIDRFEDFERIDLTRTEQFESVQGLERFGPAGGFIRPEPIERPAKL